MLSTIGQAIEAILAAVATYQRELVAYDRDPAFRREDQERDRAELADRRGQAISQAADTIGREDARVRREFERRRQTTFDPVAVQSAWTRTEKLLTEGGLGVAEVLALSPGDRDVAEALRRELPAFFTLQMKGSSADTVARTVAEIDDTILRAELPGMPVPERQATEDELERRRSARAVDAVGRFVLRHRLDPRPSGFEMTRLGFALSEAGYEPPAPAEDWVARAERQRNSLPPELRDKLDGNVRSGFDRGPADVSLKVGGES